jgi:L-aspartate-L-methionine ligase
MIAPSVTLSDLWPADAVIVQRTADDSLDWLPQDPVWRERSSLSPLPLAGSLPIICHEAGVTSGALQLLRACGLELSPEIFPYRDMRHMEKLVAEQVRLGRRIGIFYTTRSLFAPAESYVNDPALVADLNDKANLGELLPPGTFPERTLISASELTEYLERHKKPPLVLKASTRLGTGAGRDVAICRESPDLERGRRALARAERIVVEAYHDFTHVWCLGFAIADSTVTYLGAAEQVGDDRGGYHGNWCGRIPGPDVRAVGIGHYAAEAGRSRGYRGFFGVDVGRTGAGNYLAFDLNFRNNGSTLQLLLHESVASTWGTGCTRIFHGVEFDGAFQELLERLRDCYSQRTGVPLLIFDTDRLGLENRKPICNLLLAGSSPAEVAAHIVTLREAGFGLEEPPAGSGSPRDPPR